MIKRKPKKSYIREQLIKELWHKIMGKEKELLMLKMALTLAQIGKFKAKITDYKKIDWHVSIEVPVTLGGYRDCVAEYLFINKRTGKNEHEKDC